MSIIGTVDKTHHSVVHHKHDKALACLLLNTIVRSFTRLLQSMPLGACYESLRCVYFAPNCLFQEPWPYQTGHFWGISNLPLLEACSIKRLFISLMWPNHDIKGWCSKPTHWGNTLVVKSSYRRILPPPEVLSVPIFMTGSGRVHFFYSNPLLF